LTEPRGDIADESGGSGGTRWRSRATIAVLTAVVVIAAFYLFAQYRKDPGGATAADVARSTSPGAGSLAPATQLSAPPSSLPPGGSPSVTPSASKRSSAPSAQKLQSGGFPGPANTGVPAGTSLSEYTKNCTVTKSGTVITGKLIECDPLEINTTDVTISRSKVIGSIDTTENTNESFVLEDSEVDGGVVQRPALGLTNMTVRRSNVHGGQANILCFANCDIRDSWVHTPGLADGAAWHLDGVLSNAVDGSGRSNVTLIHNTIVCDTPANSAGGGCSADVGLFADFGPVSNVVARNNMFGASEDISYCVYGGSSTKKFSSGVRNIQFEDNVFKRGKNHKCAAFGPITSFDASLPGNVWKNNVWEDGTSIAAAN
jgi:hypothetical protein